MKIAAFSDLHIESGGYEFGEVDADVIVLAGDIHTKTRSAIYAGKAFPDQEVVLVAGNHDFWRRNIDYEIEKLKESAPSNVHVLENDSIIIGDTRFLGATLWTDFDLHCTRELSMLDASNPDNGMRDYSRIREGATYKRITPSTTARKFNKSKHFLELALKGRMKTVVVTHHAPSELSIVGGHKTSRLSPAYASRLSDLVIDSGAKLWVHGHTHSSLDYLLGDTRVICNPKGYDFEPNPDFDPSLTIEI